MVLGSSMNYTPEFSGATGFRFVLHRLTMRMFMGYGQVGRQMAAFGFTSRFEVVYVYTFT